MRRIGLLGGMSWESSIEYERLLNEGVRRRLGGMHSADIVLRSYDFAAIERLQSAGAWDTLAEILSQDADLLVEAGAGIILLCTNTMHVVAERFEEDLDADFLHIGDTTAAAVVSAGVERVGLLGTRFTMELDFYRARLERHGLEVLVPEASDRATIDRVIYDELVRGVVRPESRLAYLDVVDRLVAAGAQGVIAGCTEIELLIGATDVQVPFFPSMRLHVEAAIDAALAPLTLPAGVTLSDLLPPERS